MLLCHKCILLLVTLARPSLCLLSFFSNRDSTNSDPPKLELAPANATLSAGLSVTLGCVASAAARACHWSFYAADEPDKMVNLPPFAPGGKAGPSDEGYKGWPADQDCSYKIDPAEKRHSGQWVCAVVPLHSRRKMFLLSKPAYINIVDVTTSATTTTTTTTLPSVLEPEPDLFEEASAKGNNSSSAEQPQSHFVVDRSSPGESCLNITWVLDSTVKEELADCVWISPSRVRISSQSSLSNSVWISRENASCGIALTNTAENDRSLSGTWTVIAEFGADPSNLARLVTASVAVDPRPRARAAGADGTDKDVEGGDSLDSSRSSFLLITISFCAIAFTLFFVIAFFVCKYFRRSKSGNKQTGEKREYLLSSISRHRDHLPSMTYVRNPDYHPTVIERLQDRNLPETPETKNPDVKTQEIIPFADVGVHYSYILPKTEFPTNNFDQSSGQFSDQFSDTFFPAPPDQFTAPASNYVTIRPCLKKPKAAKKDDEYELVSRPNPPYENGQMAFTTFGFASLRRGEGSRRVGLGERRSDGSADSGVDSDSNRGSQNGHPGFVI